MSFHLLIEHQGLVLSAILVPFDSHWFMLRASLIAHLINHLPAMQETWVQFLGHEDPREKEMATHSSILDWRIPCTEEPGGSMLCTWDMSFFQKLCPAPLLHSYKVKVLLTQSCPTLCDPMDCSPPGSS